jgi:hypothetical protein
MSYDHNWLVPRDVENIISMAYVVNVRAKNQW